MHYTSQTLENKTLRELTDIYNSKTINKVITFRCETEAKRAIYRIQRENNA